MTSRHYKLGEKKYTEWVLRKNRIDDNLVIVSATWQLINPINNQVESSGDCEVNDDLISVLLHPSNKGRYILAATIEVPPETIVVEVEIVVY
jgi:hypothetical protein